jgi:hypothetical protein
MKVIRILLFMSSAALAWGLAATAWATDIALSFELEPVAPVASPAEAAAAAPHGPGTALQGAGEENTENTTAPLPFPSGAAHPPIAHPGDVLPPAGIYGGSDGLALGEGRFPGNTAQHLPAPPPIADQARLARSLPDPEVLRPVDSAPRPQGSEAGWDGAPPSDGEKTQPLANAPEAADKILTFELAAQQPTPPTAAESPLMQTSGVEALLPQLFAGGTDSLVARAVGSAEGTRTPEGHRTPAYFGHVDPGNGVWNLGTFSYQHGARSPEEADARQLERLQRQSQALQQRAAELGVDLNREALINGIDLANQAPQAALDRESYLDWLRRAQLAGMTGRDAIVWARTRSFLDPDTRRWNAPGLGNNLDSIARDQERRANAIAAALTASPPNSEAPASTPVPPAPSPAAATPAPEAIDAVLGLDFQLATVAVAPPSLATAGATQEPEDTAAIADLPAPVPDPVPVDPSLAVREEGTAPTSEAIAPAVPATADPDGPQARGTEPTPAGDRPASDLLEAQLEAPEPRALADADPSGTDPSGTDPSGADVGGTGLPEPDASETEALPVAPEDREDVSAIAALPPAAPESPTAPASQPPATLGTLPQVKSQRHRSPLPTAAKPGLHRLPGALPVTTVFSPQEAIVIPDAAPPSAAEVDPESPTWAVPRG